MVFSKLDIKRRSVEVLEQIISTLKSGEYQEGSQLPSERDLALTIGVSRTSVRGALAALHEVGVVERHQGSGTFVKTTDPSSLNRALAILKENVEPYEIFEWQQALEPSIALLAAKKASSRDLDIMEDALDSMRQAVHNNDRIAYSENDRQFHLAIADACANSIIRREVAELSNLMNKQVWKSMKSYGIRSEEEQRYLNKSLQFHEQLFKAISKRDSRKIKQAFEEHYQLVQKVVF